MDNPEAIYKGVVGISDFVLRYAVALSALGAVTVALIEAWKKIFATLPRFHRKAVCRWLANEAPSVEGKLQIAKTLAGGSHYGLAHRPAVRGYDPRKAYAQLLHLTTGAPLESAGLDLDMVGASMGRNVGWALFELEIAKMMTQVQDAADAALNNPERYADWFAFVTRGCNSADLAEWKAVLAGNADPLARDRGAAAYGRIRLLMRRQLDSFQTVTAFRWREWNQWWAWVAGALLMMAAQLVQPQGGDWWRVVLVSLAGGMLAPVAKDLVDVLGKVKSAA